MKKSQLLIVCIALLAILVVSCQKGRKKLANSWKVTAVEAKMPLSDSLKNVILTKGNLTFTKEGKVTGFLQNEIDGIYILSNGGKSIVIKDELGTPFPCESTIDNDQLILDSKEMKLTFESK